MTTKNSDAQYFRARLRVRVGKSVTSEATEIFGDVAGHRVSVKSEKPEQPLREAKWVIFSSGGFATSEEALAFGEQMRTIVSIIALCTRNGVDVGKDQASLSFSEDLIRALEAVEPGTRVESNVHGLMVIPDDGKSLFYSMSAEGSVTDNPQILLDSLAEMGAQFPLAAPSVLIGIRVLNAALMSNEPLAKAGLAISAIEALGQTEKWSSEQERLIKQTATSIRDRKGVSDDEREVADAIERGVHRFGLRQGVIRVLKRLNIEHLKKEWDRVYAIRSGVFHGVKHLSYPEMEQFAQDAISLCGLIAIEILKTDGIVPPTITEQRYVLSAGSK